MPIFIIKKTTIILIFFSTFLFNSAFGQTPFKYELISDVKNSQEVLFLNAIDWCLGYKRDYIIKKLKSESISGDEQIIHWEVNDKKIIETSNSIVIKSGNKYEINYTIRIEMKDDEYLYVIDNVFYSLGNTAFFPISKYSIGNAAYRKQVDNLRERFDAYLNDELFPSLKQKMKQESFKLDGW